MRGVFLGVALSFVNYLSMVAADVGARPSAPVQSPIDQALAQFKSNDAALNTWRWPDNKKLRLNQMVLLGTDNSHVNVAEGYNPKVAQHSWSLEEQLEHGVRVLSLDLYQVGRDTNKTLLCNDKKPAECSRLVHIRLCLSSCEITDKGLTLPKTRPQTLQDYFSRIARFVAKQKANKIHEIIVIYLDDETEGNVLANEIAQSPLAAMVLKPQEWDPQTLGGFPTLEWLEKSNKNIIFISEKPNSYTYFKWNVCVENIPVMEDLDQNGDFDDSLDGLSREHQTSCRNTDKSRAFFVINFFPETNVSSEQQTALNGQLLPRFIQQLFNQGMAPWGSYKGRFPQQIVIHEASLGNPIRFVNALNKVIEGNPTFAEIMGSPLKAPSNTTIQAAWLRCPVLPQRAILGRRQQRA